MNHISCSVYKKLTKFSHVNLNSLQKSICAVLGEHKCYAIHHQCEEKRTSDLNLSHELSSISHAKFWHLFLSRRILSANHRLTFGIDWYLCNTFPAIRPHLQMGECAQSMQLPIYCVNVAVTKLCKFLDYRNFYSRTMERFSNYGNDHRWTYSWKFTSLTLPTTKSS